MNKAVLAILTCLAIAANLLVPQRLLFYRACCYGEDGRLLPDSACKDTPTTGTERISGPDCCAPRECVLRSTPPCSFVFPGQQTPPGLDHAALLPAFFLPFELAIAPYAVPRSRTGAGPPGSAELLSLQSRLNL